MSVYSVLCRKHVDNLEKSSIVLSTVFWARVCFRNREHGQPEFEEEVRVPVLSVIEWESCDE